MLNGQTAIVTGCCGGIGRAIVERLLLEGASVHGLDIDAARGRQLELQLRGEGHVFTFHVVDLRRPHDLARVTADCLRGDRLDVLVNNAAISLVQSIEATSDDDLDRLLDLNLRAVYRLCRLVVPEMKRSGGGAILNVASELAVVGLPGYTAYCATKGAVLAFTRALALEVAPFGIRVNALCPGPTDTPMLHAEFERAADPVAERAANEASIPLRRFAQPSEIADVAAFLVGRRAGFVHGATILVDGGKTAI